MRTRDRLWRRTLAVALPLVLVLTLGAGSASAQAGDLVSFGFEDGVAGWQAPEWLESNAGPPVPDTAQVHGGAASLGLPVVYQAGSGWEQSGAVYRFPDPPVDLTGRVAVSFWAYAPVAGLSARFQLNDPWTEPTGLRTLTEGWNQVTYDISPTSTDFPGGITEANEIILFVVAQNLPETYDGLIWFDREGLACRHRDGLVVLRRHQLRPGPPGLGGR